MKGHKGTLMIVGGAVTALTIGVLAIFPPDWLLPEQTSTARRCAGIYPGECALDFTLSGLDANPITLGEHRGHKVLLNFFISWCDSCREEMPGVQAMFEKHQVHDWVVIGVSLKEPASDVSAFRDEFGLTFPIALDPDGKVARQYAVTGTPTNIVIDAKGQIVERRLGFMSESELEEMVAALP